MADTIGTSPPTPSDSTGSQLFQAVKDNFVVISGAAVILGVGLATIFLGAYLSSFDWHLLWFVQYTDVLTFGLIAFGIASASLVFLQAAAQTIISLFKLDARSRPRAIAALVILLVIFIVSSIWSSLHQGQGYFHLMWGALVFALTLTVVLIIIGFISAGVIPNALQVSAVVFLLVMISAAGGQWLGYSMLETARSMDITVKDTTMSGVKVLIVMSRYTIILKDREIYVLPTADIGEFHRTALPSEF